LYSSASPLLPIGLIESTFAEVGSLNVTNSQARPLAGTEDIARDGSAPRSPATAARAIASDGTKRAHVTRRRTSQSINASIPCLKGCLRNVLPPVADTRVEHIKVRR
jgi:hypothetical protein